MSAPTPRFAGPVAVVTGAAAGRFGGPQEVAAAIAFPAAAEASYLTGSSPLVDGGRSVVTASARPAAVSPTDLKRGRTT
jgi:hypothetical protein